MSRPLFKRNFQTCVKIFFLVFAVLAMYTGVIVYMYNPELAEVLSSYQNLMPEVMAAMGMSGSAANLLEWIQIYLYGFIMLLFPVIFIVVLVNKMVMRYIDSGSMADLLATPNSRRKIIRTQAISCVLWIGILMAAVSAVGVIAANVMFEGELDVKRYLLLNGSTLLLWFAVLGISFFFGMYFF